MSYRVEPQIFERFRGIRELNGINAGGEISALECSNVELVQTETGNNVGIKSVSGNITAYTLPLGYEVKGIFKSEQEEVTYKFIYGENDTKGTLFYINLQGQVEAIKYDDDTDLDFDLTGECNGLTMSSSAYDVFVFTNGKKAATVCFTADTAYGDKVKDLTATDYQSRTIHWLSMTNWNGFLVVASEYGVHSSHQNDIYTWNDNPQDVADSWYIDFSKKVTAVISFTNGLYIFTKDDISFLNTTPNDTTNSLMQTAAMNGCFSYQSIVLHDTFLFFYDDNQKNVYYIQITDTGQTRPTGPVAKEIQSYFRNIETFKMYSCIYDNRNEIWCLINDKILIYDYFQGEWVERKHQNITTVALIKNAIYSGGGGKVYVENINSTFDGQQIDSVYRTTFINIGSNSNLKKQKTPLLLVVNDNYVNDFYVQLTVNGKDKNPKTVKVGSNKSGQYYVDDETAVIIPDSMIFDSAYYVDESVYAKKVVEISTPQTWYTMSVKIFTKDPNQGFFITSMELKNIKAKTKTKGR